MDLRTITLGSILLSSNNIVAISKCLSANAILNGGFLKSSSDPSSE